MNESRPGIADSDVNCYQEMDENNPIYQAIDLGGGQVCDISGVLRELDKAGFVIVPKEPSDSMLAAALQSSLDMMKECGVDGLSPFEDYPSPAELTKRAYRAMIRAVE